MECYDELEEMTLVLNTSTELMDIEEAHLRFVARLLGSWALRLGLVLLVHVKSEVRRTDDSQAQSAVVM